MSDFPLWFEYLRALGPLLIAVFVAYIAYENWRISRANFREKLFDRRFETMRSLREFKQAYDSETYEKKDDAFWECQRNFIQQLGLVEYLFSPQAKEKLVEVFFGTSRAIRMRIRNDHRGHRVSDQEWEAMMDALQTQETKAQKAFDEAESILSQYLDLGTFEDSTSMNMRRRLGLILGTAKYDSGKVRR